MMCWFVANGRSEARREGSSNHTQHATAHSRIHESDTHAKERSHSSTATAQSTVPANSLLQLTSMRTIDEGAPPPLVSVCQSPMEVLTPLSVSTLQPLAASCACTQKQQHTIPIWWVWLTRSLGHPLVCSSRVERVSQTRNRVSCCDHAPQSETRGPRCRREPQQQIGFV
jgi:hypothetical protein